MSSLLHSHSPFRIFAISGTITVAAVLAVYYYLGLSAAAITLVLILIEITFSFENAIINARVLSTMTKFWQDIFMTIGILIAVFGMRVIFPVVVVMLTAGLGWQEVTHLAFNDPERYAHELEAAHPSIAAFGGMFLLMLALHFFFDASRRVRWINIIERPLQSIGRWWLYAAVSTVILLALSAIPYNPHPRETLIAGVLGILTYLTIHGLAELFMRQHQKSEEAIATRSTLKKAGAAGFMSFLYLEVLDASFSFDGVIGAFAVTQDVVLIAVGLGIGALWVRSLTLFMVRRKVLHAYRYLEHGAHYTITVLAAVLLLGLFQNIPEVIAGVIGITIIGASIFSSVRARQAQQALDG